MIMLRLVKPRQKLPAKPPSMPPRAKAADLSADWTVYLAECADGTLYTGIARDVVARIAVHNSGNGARYTRSRLPVRLVHQESFADKGAALRREYQVKQLPLAAKRQLVRR
jgi:predicted GIY-YIG superfamily endonuclease